MKSGAFYGIWVDSRDADINARLIRDEFELGLLFYLLHLKQSTEYTRSISLKMPALLRLIHVTTIGSKSGNTSSLLELLETPLSCGDSGPIHYTAREKIEFMLISFVPDDKKHGRPGFLFALAIYHITEQGSVIILPDSGSLYSIRGSMTISIITSRDFWEEQPFWFMLASTIGHNHRMVRPLNFYLISRGQNWVDVSFLPLKPIGYQEPKDVLWGLTELPSGK